MPERDLFEQLDQAIESLLAGTAPAATPVAKNERAADRAQLAPLTELASALRDLPSENFKDRLKTELQRRASMTTSAPIAAGLRAGFRTITPFLIHSDAPGLVAFVKTAFGAEELKRKAEANEFYSE